MSGLKYWIWLASRRGVGAKTAGSLLAHFHTPEAVYFADQTAYEALPELSQREKAALGDKDLVPARKALEQTLELGGRILTIQDAEYPERLRNIYDPPILLYIKGMLPAMDEEAAVAVVGTRRATPYGLRMAEQIAYEVSKGGGLIVSGLASGIDSAAARGALRSGRPVVGVLGNGLDVVYPRHNRRLYEDVAAVGALVTEYPPGTQPEGRNFPVRNRILSGLSAGVLVVEAPERSGALITASRALEQGRDLFVVPGNIDAPACAGSNELLKDCAAAVTQGWDILAQYYNLYPDKIRRVPSQPLEKAPEIQEPAAEPLVKSQAQAVASTKKEIDKGKDRDYIDIKVEFQNLSADESSVVSVLDTDETQVDDIILRANLPPPGPCPP